MSAAYIHGAFSRKPRVATPSPEDCCMRMYGTGPPSGRSVHVSYKAPDSQAGVQGKAHLVQVRLHELEHHKYVLELLLIGW
jgi:hypothetical protein